MGLETRICASRLEYELRRGWTEKEKENRSPKGNMWSAIPIALLCMIVIWSEGKQGSGPKGDEVL